MIEARLSRLVLASSSPRRLALLRQVHLEPDDVIPPRIDEAPLPRELPRALAGRMARAKAEAVASRLSGERAFVLAADTVVACGRRILGKARSESEARCFLELLSGRRHRVYGGVHVVAPDGRTASRVVLTRVKFKRLALEELEEYLASGEWRSKAGGYAIQGLAAAYIPEIYGSYTNVVGLPVAETVALLRGLGFRRR